MTNTAGEGDDVNVLPANLQPARETEHTATGSAEETEQEKEEQVRWEYHYKDRWDAYDQYNNDKIEAAYLQYQADESSANCEVEITVKGTFKFTINFKDMNSTSHGHKKHRSEKFIFVPSLIGFHFSSELASFETDVRSVN